MGSIITIDISKNVIPADIIAQIHGYEETAKQEAIRKDFEHRERMKQYEAETRAFINTELLNGKRTISINAGRVSGLCREDVCSICERIRKDFEKQGYHTYGWGRYAESNYYQWYQFMVCV